MACISLILYHILLLPRSGPCCSWELCSDRSVAPSLCLSVLTFEPIRRHPLRDQSQLIYSCPVNQPADSCQFRTVFCPGAKLLDGHVGAVLGCVSVLLVDSCFLWVRSEENWWKLVSIVGTGNVPLFCVTGSLFVGVCFRPQFIDSSSVH